jgi:hypothetical protein
MGPPLRLSNTTHQEEELPVILAQGQSAPLWSEQSWFESKVSPTLSFPFYKI